MLIALMLFAFMIAMESTIVATAVPTIVDELGGFGRFHWLFSMYLVAQVVAVPICGNLIDIVGRRPVLLTGVALFLLGCVACALAWEMPALLVARAVQGIGAGAILPTILTIAGDLYTIPQRAKVQAYLAAMWALASVVGPVIGGAFVEILSWRFIFLVNAPIGIAASWLMWVAYKVPFTRRAARIDVVGWLTLSVGMLLLMTAILEDGATLGWQPWTRPALLGLGVLALVAFAAIERRAADPIVPGWVVRSRVVSAAALASLCVGVILLSLVGLIPLYLSWTVGASPVEAGLAVGALTIGWPLSGALAGQVYLRKGFRTTALLGSLITALGVGSLALSVLDPSILWTTASSFVVGLGLGLIANPTIIAAQASVDLYRRGVVSGVSSLARSFGSAVGVSVFGAAATAVIADLGGMTVPEAVQAGVLVAFGGVCAVSLVLVGIALMVPKAADRQLA